MAVCPVLDCNNYYAIKCYLNDSHWSELIELRYHWSDGVRKEWHREYIRKALKPRYCEVWWWECLARSQRDLRIPVRPHSEWPASRHDMLHCLFVFKGAQVIISGLAAEEVCYDLFIPKELCRLIKEFVGGNPGLVCDYNPRRSTTHRGPIYVLRGVPPLA